MKTHSKKIFFSVIILILAFSLLAAFLPGFTRKKVPLVYVTNERDGTVSVIDAETDKLIKTIDIGARPRGIRMNADGSRAYIALSTPINRNPKPEFDRIVALDTYHETTPDTFRVGTDPEALDISPDEKYLYASNEDAGTATITDIKTKQPIATLIVGIEPEGVTLSPDGRWVYVMAETSNTVSVIDTEKREVVKTFMVGMRPRFAAFSPDGKRAFVTAELGKTLSVVDTANHEITATVPLLQDEDAKPVGILVSPDGNRIYIANGRAGSVSVLDGNNYQLIKTIPVGKRVWNIAMTPDGRKIYTANGGTNDVSVIDTATDQVIKTIKAGDGPWGIAVSYPK